MSLEEAKDIYDLRIAIETFVMRKTFEFITDEDVMNLRELIQKQKDAFLEDEGKSSIESMKHDMEFHSYFLKFYENEKIDQIFNSYTERFISFGYIALLRPGRIYTTLSEHDVIVDALERRDLEGAIESLKSHLENGKRNALMG